MNCESWISSVNLIRITKCPFLLVIERFKLSPVILLPNEILVRNVKLSREPDAKLPHLKWLCMENSVKKIIRKNCNLSQLFSFSCLFFKIVNCFDNTLNKQGRVFLKYETPVKTCNAQSVARYYVNVGVIFSQPRLLINSHMGTLVTQKRILYFPIPHNTLCLPAKFCINHCF